MSRVHKGCDRRPVEVSRRTGTEGGAEERKAFSNKKLTPVCEQGRPHVCEATEWYLSTVTTLFTGPAPTRSHRKSPCVHAHTHTPGGEIFNPLYPSQIHFSSHQMLATVRYQTPFFGLIGQLLHFLTLFEKSYHLRSIFPWFIPSFFLSFFYFFFGEKREGRKKKEMRKDDGPSGWAGRGEGGSFLVRPASTHLGVSMG